MILVDSSAWMDPHALSHDTPILTKDGDFENMRAAGVPIHLVEW